MEGLLDAFRDLKLPDSITDRFHIMGGECNYLLRVRGSLVTQSINTCTPNQNVWSSSVWI